jgi:hypothetical protein
MTAQNPLVRFVAERLVQRDGQLLLEPPVLDQLGVRLKRQFGKPELLASVRALLLFAFFLERRKRSPLAARGILAVLERVGPAVEALEIAAGR